MALAQHYGIPTHGFDVTTNLDVATWFACNKFASLSDGKSTYRQLDPSSWPNDREKWPAVIVGQVVTHSLGMSLQSCEELGQFGIHALRPQRQHGLFFMVATLTTRTEWPNRLYESFDWRLPTIKRCRLLRASSRVLTKT
jgi:hypothetical protein